jgi:hypothetical protein
MGTNRSCAWKFWFVREVLFVLPHGCRWLVNSRGPLASRPRASLGESTRYSAPLP